MQLYFPYMPQRHVGDNLWYTATEQQGYSILASITALQHSWYCPPRVARYMPTYSYLIYLWHPPLPLYRSLYRGATLVSVTPLLHTSRSDAPRDAPDLKDIATKT